MKTAFASLLLLTTLIACSEKESAVPMLHITFLIDSTAMRLDNLGNPIEVAMGNSAQSPDFDQLGLHFIGLYRDKFTPYESGVTVYSSPNTDEGGVAAIDFERELILDQVNNRISVPLSAITPGTYEYFRSSIGFQKYTIVYNLGGASSTYTDWPTGVSDDIDVLGTIASFLGYNTYIKTYELDDRTVDVYANRLQGYFGLESFGVIAGYQVREVTEGESDQTTVPNPIDDTSPVPAGSCVVTGKFPEALKIPDAANQDINIRVIVSINKSFEWEDTNSNGKYEPLLGERVVDMGTRGVFPSVQ